jgi:hypothetical protein
VIRLVGGDKILGTGEAGQDAEVGLISGGIEECGGEAYEIGQGLLEMVMWGEVTGEEPGGTGAKAVLEGGLGGGRREPGMVGESEIVVGREG